MRIPGSFLLALLVALGASGQSLCWRLVPPDGGAPSYLLGTVHSRDARAFTHAHLAAAAMGRVDAVVGELDLSQVGADGAGLLGGMMLPTGTDPEGLYGRGGYKRVRKALEERLGVMAPMLLRMRPFYIMAALSEQEMRTDSAQVLDQYLQSLAIERGLAVLGLETMREQLAAVEAIPLKEQADMLIEQLRSKRSRTELETMMELYAANDLDGVGRLVASSAMSEGADGALLSKRNAVMAQRMDSLMRAGRHCLFAIGAAHLMGSDGVLDALQRRGYRTVAVKREEEL